MDVNNWEKKINNGISIDLESKFDRGLLFKGYNERKCLMLNGKVIKSVKTWLPILKEINNLNLKEV